jgi:hypothetical protein
MAENITEKELPKINNLTNKDFLRAVTEQGAARLVEVGVVRDAILSSTQKTTGREMNLVKLITIPLNCSVTFKLVVTSRVAVASIFEISAYTTTSKKQISIKNTVSGGSVNDGLFFCEKTVGNNLEIYMSRGGVHSTVFPTFAHGNVVFDLTVAASIPEGAEIVPYTT